MRGDVSLDALAAEAGAVGRAHGAAARSAGAALALWAILLAGAGVGLGAHYDRSFIAIDGAFFVSAAQNLARGHGFATSIVWSEEHYRLGGMPAPQTNFPPGFPLLIALASRLGVDAPVAGFVVALLAFAAVPLVMYDILRAAGRPGVPSFVVSAVWLAAPFVWFNVLGGMSETTFILLTLLSVRCVVQGERDAARRLLWLAAAGTLAGLAFGVRYQGVYFVVGLALFFALRLVRRRDRASLRAVLLVVGTASPFVVALFARNLALTGKLTGAMIPGERSLFEVLQTLQWGLGGLFGFTKAGLVEAGVAEVGLAIVLVAGLAGAIGRIGGLRIDAAALRSALAQPHVGVGLAYIAVSLALMLEGARHYATGHISPRYLLALVPFALLCLPDAFRIVRLPARRAWQAWAVRLWSTAAVTVVLLGQVQVFQQHRHRAIEANPYRTISDALQRPFAGQTVMHFLRERITTESPLLGNEAQLLGAVLDRPVLGLTQASYTREVWTDDVVRGLLAAYGVAYVVFFPGLFDPAQPADQNAAFFHGLARGDAPPWLVSMLATPDVRLYRVAGVSRE